MASTGLGGEFCRLGRRRLLCEILTDRVYGSLPGQQSQDKLRCELPLVHPENHLHFDHMCK
jgi:hypothetical protein